MTTKLVAFFDAAAALAGTNGELAATADISRFTFSYYTEATGNETGTLNLLEKTAGSVHPINSTTDTISEVAIRDGAGHDMVTINGLSLVYADLAAALSGGGISSVNYVALVGLLDGDVKETGSNKAEPYLEVGAGGKATVTAGGGDDVLRVWQPKTVDFNGGKGSDLLSFQAYIGPYPIDPTQGAVVDLAKGTGTNPYGGAKLTLDKVENVIGTALADTFTGSNKANIFGDGIYDGGADVIKGKGGDDRVELAEQNGGGVRANGGNGHDTLAINMGLGAVAGPHILDLGHPENNAGMFAGDRFTNFETFAPGSGFFAPTAQIFDFRDTDDNHTAVAMAQTNILRMNGGKDTVVLSVQPNNYSADADGGKGKDTLQFEVSFFAPDNRLDLTDQSTNSGIFANGGFTHFEIFTHVEGDGAYTFLQRFTFVGDGKAQTVIGAYGIDDIDGGGGNDVISGGSGNDLLTGGKGKDKFIFDAAIGGATPALANVDTITDFRPKDDTILLENKIFKGIGGPGVLAKVMLSTAKGGTHIAYDGKTGDVSYAKGGSEIVFAVLDPGLHLTHKDFLIV